MRTIMRKLLTLTIPVFLLCVNSNAATSYFFANLSGANEAPPTNSAGTGTASVIYDSAAHTLQVTIVFSGLTGITTASHIHCCAAQGTNASVATTTPSFAGFPTGVQSGSFSIVLDLTQMSSFNPSFVTANGGTAAGAEAALTAGMAAGQSYLNVHTQVFPGGEIRGQLQSVSAPVLLKSFGATDLTFNPTTTLFLTMGNPNSSIPLNGVGFTDTLPSGLIVSTPNAVTSTCGSGTVTAIEGGSLISVSGVTLPGTAACTVAVGVTGITDGTKVNTTSAVTSTNGGPGNTASATVVVRRYMLYLWSFL